MVYVSKQRSFTGYATVSQGAGPEGKGFAMDINCEFLFLVLKKKKKKKVLITVLYYGHRLFDSTSVSSAPDIMSDT